MQTVKGCSRVGSFGVAALFALVGCSGDDSSSGVGGAAGTTSSGNLVSSSQSGEPAGSGGRGGGGAGGEGGEGGGAAGGVPWGPDANYPYVLTNYDEPYRGQVHFTAPMGWLNDVNGVWFYGGLYHLSYQAFPYSIEGDAKHWGHATSTDMIHWTHWPIMLDPGGNVPGDAWSGSTVVDENNTSGLKTGANPVLVTVYTATSLGTSLAFSNDLGVTWQAYDGNPVAIGGPNEQTRDPHVFWHEPTQKWVCAYYEDGGTSFYTSSDLRNWKHESHIGFGFECPDIYELPVDGDAANRKWVLQDASGAYIIGRFDGTKFTPDTTQVQKMDMSPSFYAAQTFYRRNFPDSRVVQMAWLRGMDRVTAPWNQSISFPTQLSLVTFPEGVRLARAPITEIQGLYGASQHFGEQSVGVGVNPFAAIQSKVFDLEVVIDVARTTTRAVDFKLANRTFTYDLQTNKLFDATVSPIGGKVKIRVLRDWGQFSVFANDGEVSFTEAFAFEPADASLSVTATGAGNLALTSADFHPLNRAWPGVAATSSVILDDGQAAVTYSGTWVATGEGRYFGSSCHFSRAQGDAFEVPFSGTRVEWYGLKNGDLGKADVYVDGALVQAGIDAYSAKRQNALLFTIGGLANGPHTLKVVANGQKSVESSGVALVHDYIISYIDP